MSTYERRTFRWFWIAWTWAVTANTFVTHGLVLADVLWVIFGCVEIWGAVRRSGDDTESEFVWWFSTWTVGSGWRAAAWFVAFTLAWSAGITASFAGHGAASVQTFSVGSVTLISCGPNVVFGAITFLLVLAWLGRHFLRPPAA